MFGPIVLDTNTVISSPKGRTELHVFIIFANIPPNSPANNIWLQQRFHNVGGKVVKSWKN